jgi:hypothetical protein
LNPGGIPVRHQAEPNLAVSKTRLQALAGIGLLLLIVGTLLLDFFHGIALGQDRVAYQPLYRLRQSLAVAVSRLHDPALGGYLAYKSVVDVLSENGFAALADEPGPRLDTSAAAALINDGPRLDRIIQQAKDAAVDVNLPPDIIRANELGLADYIYFSFRLFGANVAALYYFLFMIVFVACLLYAAQFRDSPFLLFLLVLFLGGLYFLENYAHSNGAQLNTVSNSRLFSGLSLVPAVHILLVLWQRRPPRAFTVAAVIAQSVIFAFLLSCRTEVSWQAAMIVAVACAIGLSLLLARPAQADRSRPGRLRAVWPVGIFLLVVSAYAVIVSLKADVRYAAEPENHILWHEVLMGILGANPELRRDYVGDNSPPYGDQVVYAAILHDLNARNDASSPIVSRAQNGQLTLDADKGWSEYEKLIRSLTLRIVRQHPWAVLGAVPARIRDQILWYDLPGTHSMAWSNVRLPVTIIAIGALLCAMAGGFAADSATLRSAIYLIATVLLFAAVTPVLIRPSGLAIGTLFAYLGAIAIAAAYGMAFAFRGLTGIKPPAEGV